jgi:hypothetical protein
MKAAGVKRLIAVTGIGAGATTISTFGLLAHLERQLRSAGAGFSRRL